MKASYTSSETVYVNREYQRTSIRLMFGKPHSPWPAQQQAYVVVQKNGSFYDKFGRTHEFESPAVHIPLEEFQIQW